MPGVWNAGAESVWFPKTKQVSAPTSEIHSPNHPSGLDCFTQAKTTGIDSCWFETRKHHVARSCQTTLQSEGKKNIIKVMWFKTWKIILRVWSIFCQIRKKNEQMYFDLKVKM